MAVAIQGLLFVGISQELREQQRIVEWGIRRQLGLDLKRLAGDPKETVFLEPLGYIGFYSNLAMRDTPGLCSPEVVTLRRAGVRAAADLIAALKPDWTVLRAGEYAAFPLAQRGEFHRAYRIVAVYDARAAINSIAWLPGRDFLLFDAHYLVWRRRTSASERP